MKVINKLWKCFNNPILHKFEREISFNDLDKIENKIKALEILKNNFYEEYKLPNGKVSLLFRLNDNKDLELVKKELNNESDNVKR